MKHSDWKDWLNAGLYFLVMLFALLSHSFGGEQELTVQDIKVIHNINRALARSPLKDHGYWIVLYSKKYKQNPYLIFAIIKYETSLGKHCPAKYNCFCRKNKWREQRKKGIWKKYPSFKMAIEDNCLHILELWGEYTTPEKMSDKIKWATHWQKWRKWVKGYMREMEEGK